MQILGHATYLWCREFPASVRLPESHEAPRLKLQLQLCPILHGLSGYWSSTEGKERRDEEGNGFALTPIGPASAQHALPNATRHIPIAVTAVKCGIFTLFPSQTALLGRTSKQLPPLNALQRLEHPFHCLLYVCPEAQGACAIESPKQCIKESP